MKKVTDRYDFKQPSRSGKFGFETFRHPKDNMYYFHFNDTKGQAVLYSQAYRDKKSRDHGLQSVLDNIKQSDRYLKHESPEGKHFLVLKAGNNHEIARSREFENRREMTAMLELLSSFDSTTTEEYITEVKLPAKTKSSKSPSKSVSKSTKSKAGAEDLPRFRFNLTYYPDSEIWILKNNFSDENSITFKELDGEKISTFVQSQIPEKVVESKGKSKSKYKVKSISAPNEFIRALMLKTTDGKLRKRMVSKNKLSQVVMDLADYKPFGQKVVNFDAKVFVESIRDHRKMLIGELIDRLPQEGQLEVPIISHFLQRGIYRLTAELSIKDEERQLEALDSSQIIMVS
jgi:uncharacterized protein YegP (UPF0339 family)